MSGTQNYWPATDKLPCVWTEIKLWAQIPIFVSWSIVHKIVNDSEFLIVLSLLIIIIPLVGLHEKSTRYWFYSGDYCFLLWSLYFRKHIVNLWGWVFFRSLVFKLSLGSLFLSELKCWLIHWVQPWNTTVNEAHCFCWWSFRLGNELDGTVELNRTDFGRVLFG